MYLLHASHARPCVVAITDTRPHVSLWEWQEFWRWSNLWTTPEHHISRSSYMHIIRRRRSCRCRASDLDCSCNELFGSIGCPSTSAQRATHRTLLSNATNMGNMATLPPQRIYILWLDRTNATRALRIRSHAGNGNWVEPKLLQR